MAPKLKLIRNAYKREGEETHRGVVQHTETLNQEAILDEMEWHSSTLTKTDMLAFLESHDRAIVRALLKGKRVVTNLVHYKLSVKGEFDGEDDQLDDVRHEICASVSRGPLLRNAINNKTVTLEKERATAPRPRLDRHINLHNSDPDTALSPTHMSRLEGDKLRFDPADPEQGLFLVPQGNGNEPLADGAAIRVEEIARLTYREIIFRVPDALVAGHYKAEVRSRFGTNLRIGRLEEELIVF